KVNVEGHEPTVIPDLPAEQPAGAST
ncbi:MAG: hypothetical protein QOE25_1471, partial [Actinomycetota bacterium]|nr:hypothetical protein [Actinomycetota bacterium]